MNKKPSLSFYTNIPTPNQLSFFRELARHFNVRIIFYSISEQGRTWDFSLQGEPFEVVILKNNFIATLIQRWVIDFHFSWKIFSVVLRDKSQYVIVGGAYWVPNALVAILLSKLRAKNTAYFSEPLYEVNSVIKYACKWLFLRVINLGCDLVFCVSRKAAASFSKYDVTIPKYLVPYNIDPALYQEPDKTRVLEYAKQYKNNGEIILLSSGSLIHRKGMDILIQAFKQIPHPDLRLLILGEGPDRESLQALCGDDGRILLLGFKQPDELPYFFALADVFAFASRYDGWALVINEAIAANVPIVSSDQVGAALELITSPEVGFICESGKIDDFKQAIEILVYNPRKRQELRQNSFPLIKRISSQYNAELVRDILLSGQSIESVSDVGRT